MARTKMLIALGCAAQLLWAAAPQSVHAQRGGGGPVEIPESRIIQDGDLEMLTFDTEEDYWELQERLKASLWNTPSPGTKTTQYLRADTDGSVQPYSLWLPTTYKQAETFPLVIQLHGIGPRLLAGRRLQWAGQIESEWVDNYTPAIQVDVFARQNTFYQGMGEAEVMQVVAEVKRRFSVDDDRVFIMGHSMGGAGSFMVGLHYPDQFGSITPVDPAMGMMGGGESIPDWMMPQLAINDPANLFRNARNTKVYFKLAGASSVGGGDREARAAGIVAHGGFSTVESFPGMPHHFAPQHSYATFIPQVMAHPIERRPEEVKFYTNTLRYNRAYWATIDQLEQHNADATIEARYDSGRPAARGGGRGRGGAAEEPEAPRSPALRASTQNIAAFTLRLRDALPDSAGATALVVDDQEVLTGTLPVVVHLAKTDGAWGVVDAPATAGKRHGVQGPIGDAFNTRFLIVYGDSEDKALAIAEMDAMRAMERLCINGDFPMKAAANVTEEDVRDYSLILFGSAQSNAVIGRIAGSLPAGLLEGDTIFIQPNPENPDRYAVVWNAKLLSAPDNGLAQGFTMPINTLPDYVKVADGKVESGGFFDNEWKMAAE